MENNEKSEYLFNKLKRENECWHKYTYAQDRDDWMWCICRCGDHFEYIADPSKDCRKELVESLISDLKEEGSIIVYSNFKNL